MALGPVLWTQVVSAETLVPVLLSWRDVLEGRL